MTKAFTIIELLISIAIMATITALGVATFTNYNEEKQLKSASAQLAAKIGELRLRAFAGQRVESAVPKIFGVQVEGDMASYSLFADFDGDCWFEEDDILIEKVALAAKIVFQPIPGQKVCFKTNEALNFVCVNENECSGKDIIFYLSTPSGEAKQRVVVNPQNGMARVE